MRCFTHEVKAHAIEVIENRHGLKEYMRYRISILCSAISRDRGLLFVTCTVKTIPLTRNCGIEISTTVPVMSIPFSLRLL